MRTLLLIVLAWCLVAQTLAGCGKGGAKAPPPLEVDLSTPAAAVGTFVVATLRRDTAALAQCISASATDETLAAAHGESASDEQLSALSRRVREGRRSDREPRVEDDRATVFMDGMDDLTLVLEDGSWRVLDM